MREPFIIDNIKLQRITEEEQHEKDNDKSKELREIREKQSKNRFKEIEGLHVA
jgi:hypothetical protein